MIDKNERTTTASASSSFLLKTLYPSLSPFCLCVAIVARLCVITVREEENTK